ncbi:hypothetical protein BVG16_27655 [Paenibacillus selenitireducens]|uniref:DUF3153 domain-containing protein n=1 Tax=Paenibacillus selenitireducens TaxID=1324314 RepID=A0A1T2X112_9BACL|nr:DUF3153 domain-containing protein [Paenibacillus selenitireducens]OPA73589.1 hypothetical protein BVG16_27655 [Paenibacillus selenitireducens]
MKSRYRWIPVGLLLLSMCILSSCAKGNAHFTIHLNGMAEFEMNLSVNKDTLTKIGMPELMKQITEQFQDKSMEVKPYDEGGRVGFTLSRTINLRDMNNISLPQGITIKRTEMNKFFYTKEQVIVTVDIEKLISNKEYGDWLQKNPVTSFVKNLVQRQIDFEILLTAPLKPGYNNAEEIRDHGRTLVWNLKIFEPNHFEINFTIPNIRTIAYSAGILIVVLILLWSGIRISRKRRRTD